MYIRSGRWCKCERSCNTDKGYREIGVSVYECESKGHGVFVGIGDAFSKLERLSSNDQSLFDRLAPWFIVTGDRVGTGADREPLLNNVKPVKHINWNVNRFVIQSEYEGVIVYEYHPNYPNCKCDSVDDMLSREENLENDDIIEMFTPPLKSLSNTILRAILTSAEACGSLSSVLCAMSQDEQDELYGIALYGKSKNNFDFQWHLDHITDAGIKFDLLVSDLREGLRRLGINLD